MLIPYNRANQPHFLIIDATGAKPWAGQDHQAIWLDYSVHDDMIWLAYRTRYMDDLTSLKQEAMKLWISNTRSTISFATWNFQAWLRPRYCRENKRSTSDPCMRQGHVACCMHTIMQLFVRKSTPRNMHKFLSTIENETELRIESRREKENVNRRKIIFPIRSFDALAYDGLEWSSARFGIEPGRSETQR